MRNGTSMSTSRRVIAVLAVVGLLAVGGAAWAYFTSSGSGSGAAATGSLNPPTSVNAGPTSGATVPVHWTASSTGGSAATPQGYFVTESNGSTTSPACGTDSTHLITSGTSCTDGNGTIYAGTTGGPTNPPLANGSYTYTVVAVYHSWSATGTSGSVSVNVAAPTVTATVIGQASGAVVNGYVQDNSSYYVYANVTDNSGTGIQNVTANLANVTSGDTAVTLTAGSYSAPGGGGSYAYRSGLIISNLSQPDGLVNYTVNATDNSARTSTYSNNGSMTFDTTGPAVSAPSISAAVTYGSNPTYVSNETVTLTDTSVSDAGSGVQSVAYYYCAGSSGPCSTTLIGSSNTASGNYSVTWNTPPTDGPYRIEAVATDNVTNATTSASTLVTVDTTPPNVSTPSVNGIS